MKNFNHIDAKSFYDATESIQSCEAACPIAGGTDLIGVLKQQILEDYPDTLVNLKNIENADYIKDEGDVIAIGALTKLSKVEESELIGKEIKAVAEAAKSVASPIVRHAATIGGNICQDVRCWYYRYPHSIGGRIDCARKGGAECYAIRGRNAFHAVMGGVATGSLCSQECPAGIDIPGYMQKIREGDWDAAAEIILSSNPMPMLTSRICPHNCQTACNQQFYGDAVSIHSVERTLGDYILENVDKFYKVPEKETGKKAAIIGGGPAGLSAAYNLRKAGHAVTIYDKMEEAGGVLMYGIPEYRMPKHYVRSLVKAIANMGVEFKLNTEVGKDITIEEIKEASDSVFLNTGAWKQPILGIEGENLTQFGLNFLVEVKAFIDRQIGKSVLVCGGGNVAMDVALTAVRLGAQDVTLISLEEREEMPAIPEEIHRAEEEGVKIFNGWGLNKVVTDAEGSVKGLQAIKCVSVFDENNRFSPVYDVCESKVFEADSIILATGQKVDLDFLGDKFKDEIKDARGLVEIGEHKETRAPGVYAGGDMAGPSIAIDAIRDGVIAARNMSAYMGFPTTGKVAFDGFLKQDLSGIEKAKADIEVDTPVSERTLEKEDTVSLNMAEAEVEARRCMNCGCYSVNASDISPVLIALNATIVTTSREFKAEEFFKAMDVKDALDPGEIVKEIRIPKATDYRCGYLKLRMRDSIDFAITSLAYAYREDGNVIKDARLVAGGVAPIPVRLTAVENLLAGKTKSVELAEEAADLAIEGASPLRESKYKLSAMRSQVKESLEV